MQKTPLSSSGAGLAAAALAIFFVPSGYTFDTDGISRFRSISGSGNNPFVPNAGRADSLLIRRTGAVEYGDGVDLPRGVLSEDEGDGDIEVDEQTRLPSARSISNAVHDQGSADIPSGRRLNQLFFQFGQFLSHDTGLTEPDSSVATGGNGLSGNESFNIEVSGSDPDFAFPEIHLTRSISESAASSPSGLREQINTITAFIDASNVYGSDTTRANALRTFVGGKLRDQSGPDGPLLPLNTFGVENANPLHLDEESMFAAGDVRANEQIGLIAIHTIFMREHNRVAEIIARQEFPHSDLTNSAVDNEIYLRARAVVGATLQKIAYYEWLPTLLGFDALPPYRGYDPGVDPQISNEFSSAAFRLGHTMLPSVYVLRHDNGVETPFPLQFAFFNPDHVKTNGINAIIRGQAGNLQQEIDRFIVDDVRNFLFGPGFGGLDLAALNIQRGRDHGIAPFHNLRLAYGLSGVSDFSDITSEQGAASALLSAYGSGNAGDVDAWTGGVSEVHLPGTSLGRTFTEIFVDQFTRLRDGDRFYFENPEIYTASFTRQILATSFADVIRLNTGLNRYEVNDFAFFRADYNPFQPDLTIGKRRSLSRQKGRDRYNSTAWRQRISRKVRAGRRTRNFFYLQNDSAFESTFSLNVSIRSRHQVRPKIYEYGPEGRRNQTGSSLSGRYRLTNYPGELRRFKTVLRVSRSASRSRNTTIKYRAANLDDYRARDTVKARLRLRS
ncbi:MAG: hypothetical protein MI807_16950 [Verrucomicrobiales bacterium]|nr:hypothetical protein [Verrucomicrobiales bacterium]